MEEDKGRWGTAKEYAELHRLGGSLYAPRLLRWLERENPELHAQVLRLMRRKAKEKD